MASAAEIGWKARDFSLKGVDGKSHGLAGARGAKGTLVAFIAVSIGVIVLRQRQPDLPRSFKVPLYPVTPILAILGCLLIIKSPWGGLRAITIYVFVIWVLIAFVGYFFYGRKHSHLGRHEHVGLATEDETPL